jgi:hypothetical protein
LGLQYQHTGLATTRGLIKSRPDLVRNLMKAYVEGIHYYKTHRNESLVTLRKYLKTANSDALTEIYEDIGLGLIPEKPYPTLRGIEIMLQELAATDSSAQKARPEQFVDLTFIKELDSSGFIDNLYKTTPAGVAAADRRTASAPVSGKSQMDQPRIAAKVAPPGADTREAQEHVIQAGDTLSHLALRYYGGAHKWMKIYDANRETLKNPHYLYIGQKILVPPADNPETS